MSRRKKSNSPQTDDTDRAEKEPYRGEAGEAEATQRGKQDGDDDVEEASLESFPASDAPSY